VLASKVACLLWRSPRLGAALPLRRHPAPVEEAAAALMVGQEQHAALRLGAEEGAR
jgi:hypothetical protein